MIQKLAKDISIFSAITVMAYLFFQLALGNINIAKTNQTSALIHYTNDYLILKGKNEYISLRVFDAQKQYDYIVIGTSHAYRGYDPRVFKKRNVELYNFGTSAQSLNGTYELIQKYLTKQNCKMLILDIYYGSFQFGDLETSMAFIANANDHELVFRGFKIEPDIRSVNGVFNKYLDFHVGPRVMVSDYVENGYCETFTTNKNVIDSFPKSYEGKKELLQPLEDITHVLKEKEINFILVSHPLPLVKNSEQYHQSYLQFLAPLLKKYPASKYYDFTVDNRFDNTLDFSDNNHLNQDGVIKFNTILLQELEP